MEILTEIESQKSRLIQWRRDMHADPELAFSEHNTRELICDLLSTFGIEFDVDDPRGLAGTGVVGCLSAGSGKRSIALRADMDALPVIEANSFAHRSKNPGAMHACGHDGHVAMLLGAAQYLAKHQNFDGTVYFIFQPAEENKGGAKVMIEDGLFSRYPAEQVYAMHNWPGLAQGKFGVKPGPMMASLDTFEIVVEGEGCHAATPERGRDTVLAASAIVCSLHNLLPRQLDTRMPSVISVTRIQGGQTDNVLPDKVVLGGTTRSFCPKIGQKIETAIDTIASSTAATHGVTAQVTYVKGYPPTINDAKASNTAAEVAAQLVGAENVESDFLPSMTSEDFAFMLQQRPGSYIWIGNGDAEDQPALHSSRYDFNDEILVLGSHFWVNLVEHILAENPKLTD